MGSIGAALPSFKTPGHGFGGKVAAPSIGAALPSFKTPSHGFGGKEAAPSFEASASPVKAEAYAVDANDDLQIERRLEELRILSDYCQAAGIPRRLSRAEELQILGRQTWRGHFSLP